MSTSWPLPASSEARFDTSPHHAAIFDSQHLDGYRQAMQQALELVCTQMDRVFSPHSGISHQALRPSFDQVNLDQALGGLPAALQELSALYLRDAVYFHHPHYVAHLNCPILIPALAAELILSAINSSMDTWDQSAGATLIEQKIIDWTSRRIGLPESTADGVLTSGGTQSNLMALYIARDQYGAGLSQDLPTKQIGLPEDFRKFRILASQASHFSLKKATAILGLGYQAVVPVDCDAQWRMQPQALEQAIGNCACEGTIPILVVATAGTTDFGSIDPLPAIASICQRHRLRLHVDAAYGCGLLISPRHRHLLAGIEHADSITVDYHKSFFQPVSCSALFVRNRADWQPLSYHADYLNPSHQAREGVPNLVEKSLQTTRRFDALKLWLSLRSLGPETIGHLFDELIDKARLAHALLVADPAFVPLHEPQLSALTFRYRPSCALTPEQTDKVHLMIRQRLQRSGQAMVAGTRVHDRQCLKFTLLNPQTSLRDLEQILNEIKHQGQACSDQLQTLEGLSA